MSQFYLTLPSNSSAKFYPDNTVTQFNTRLHQTFDLTGEWEVGMTEIMFPRSWYNIDKDEGYFIVSCTDCTSIDPNPLSNVPRNYTFAMHIPSGYYDTMEKIVDQMNEMVQRYFRQPVQQWSTPDTQRRVHSSVWPRFRYNSVNRKFYATLHPNMRVRFANKLTDTLGIGNKQNPMLNPSNQEMTIRGSRACDLEGGLHALYVYCDLLECVPVGDAMAPLLGIVDAEGKLGEVVKRSFEKPRYIPLQKKSFDSVEIFIRDAHGKPVAFENGRSTVTLHFRRAKASYFLG